ncbi:MULTISPECIES: SRPBCC domain-containing protein [unclassified Sphingopyxis]|uniref:SRPBCC domain-containing protein n=1 Tax=unclassified Sphingopyxis TaxID=2614943 RepID=UPI000A919D5C|nr:MULTISPECIES: SRPBCC domain-containing protein [unclassified Sphingopyxis]
MSAPKQGERVDSTSRIILASPRMLFRTFLDPETLKAWRIPEGVDGGFSALDPRAGGGYRLELRYADEAHGVSAPGKDLVEGHFVDFLADERVLERVRFLGEDRREIAAMTFETLIEAAQSGTKVTLRATGVPDAVGADTHREALAAALRRLALLTE